MSSIEMTLSGGETPAVQEPHQPPSLTPEAMVADIHYRRAVAHLACYILSQQSEEKLAEMGYRSGEIKGVRQTASFEDEPYIMAWYESRYVRAADHGVEAGAIPCELWQVAAGEIFEDVSERKDFREELWRVPRPVTPQRVYQDVDGAAFRLYLESFFEPTGPTS